LVLFSVTPRLGSIGLFLVQLPGCFGKVGFIDDVVPLKNVLALWPLIRMATQEDWRQLSENPDFAVLALKHKSCVREKSSPTTA
jgi:hypothetical protein